MAAQKRGRSLGSALDAASKVPAPLTTSIRPLQSAQHFDLSRVRAANSAEYVNTAAPVVYWMSREQRYADNWALLYAQARALDSGAALVVIFNFVPTFLGATWRQYSWMLDGLEEIHAHLEQLGIPFLFVHGNAEENIPRVAQKLQAQLVVCDFSPLRIGERWRRKVGQSLSASNIPLHEVDAHNIVPAWLASDKIEYAARTIRKKLHEKLPQYLVEFPPLKEQPTCIARLDRWYGPKGPVAAIAWDEVRSLVEADQSVLPVCGMQPGSRAAQGQLELFLTTIKGYASKRNDPTLDACSGLSPYLHFGQLSAQRAILEAKAKRSTATAADVDAFVEEAFVRRELAENYCLYNTNGYDRIDGLYPQYGNDSWAQKSLQAHADDERDFAYSLDVLDNGLTHDDLWNAAQLEMKYLGKMHGFMRMYWAKKILEWTAEPQAALDAAIYLNDRYSIDGRDPNGYVGIAWCIAGVHDQGWKERPVFGKVRYMNLAGCRRKFNVEAYVERVHAAVKALQET